MNPIQIITDLPGQLNKSPLIVTLVLGITAFCMLLKKWKAFPNQAIPLVNFALGVGLYALLGDVSSVSYKVRYPEIILGIYGGLISSIVWAAHKFLLKRAEEKAPDWLKPVIVSFDTDSVTVERVKPTETPAGEPTKTTQTVTVKSETEPAPEKTDAKA